MGLTTTTKLFASLLTHYMSTCMSILATTSLDLDTYTHMDSHVYVCMYVCIRSAYTNTGVCHDSKLF